MVAIILNSNVHEMGYGNLLLNAPKVGESSLSAWVIDHGNDKKRTTLTNGKDKRQWRAADKISKARTARTGKCRNLFLRATFKME